MALDVVGASVQSASGLGCFSDRDAEVAKRSLRLEFLLAQPDAELLVDDAEEFDRVHAVQRKVGDEDIPGQSGRDGWQTRSQPLRDCFGIDVSCSHGVWGCGAACATHRSRPKAMHAECAWRESLVKMSNRSAK